MEKGGQEEMTRVLCRALDCEHNVKGECSLDRITIDTHYAIRTMVFCLEMKRGDS